MIKIPWSYLDFDFDMVCESSFDWRGNLKVFACKPRARLGGRGGSYISMSLAMIFVLSCGNWSYLIAYPDIVEIHQIPFKIPRLVWKSSLKKHQIPPEASQKPLDMPADSNDISIANAWELFGFWTTDGLWHKLWLVMLSYDQLNRVWERENSRIMHLNIMVVFKFCHLRKRTLYLYGLIKLPFLMRFFWIGVVGIFTRWLVSWKGMIVV